MVRIRTKEYDREQKEVKTMGAFVETFKDVIYGASIWAAIMIVMVILHKAGIIDFDILHWSKKKRERR